MEYRQMYKYENCAVSHSIQKEQRKTGGACKRNDIKAKEQIAYKLQTETCMNGRTPRRQRDRLVGWFLVSLQSSSLRNCGLSGNVDVDDDDSDSADDDDEWKLYDVDDSNVVKINEQLELFKCLAEFIFPSVRSFVYSFALHIYLWLLMVSVELIPPFYFHFNISMQRKWGVVYLRPWELTRRDWIDLNCCPSRRRRC